MAETTQNSKQNVQAPQAGQTVIVNAIPGQDIVLEAAFDQAEVKMDGGNVVFEFEGGGQVVLNFTDLGDAQAPNVVMPDGTVLDMQEFLASLGESDVEPAAGPEGGADGSGGVGQYREGAGDLLDSVEKLGGLEDDPFPAVTLASIEANDENPLPTAGIVGGAVDEDGLRLSEGAHFEGNDDEVGGDNPARFSYLDGTLNYDFGGDGPAGTNPFVWSLVGLPVVFSEGNQLVYEVVDDGLTLNAYYITEGFISPPNQEENSSESGRMEEGPVRVDVFSLKLTDLAEGTFRFELYQPLDHSDATTEDDINYGFTFTLTDGSGDSVVGGLNLVIDDDSPLATADGSELPSMVLDESSFGTGIVDAPQETANFNLASAISLDGHFTLGSNPDVGDSETTPFVSVSGVGSGQPDYYMFTVTHAGSTAVFDIDYGMNYGGSFDPFVHLWNSEGDRIAYDDDQGGDPGSYHSYDSYLTYTFAEPGTYYISVGRYPGFSDPDNAIPNGGTYQLQVSLTNAIMGSGDGGGIRTLTTDFSGYFDFSFGADGPEGEGVNYAMSLGAESVESGIYALGEDGQPGEQIMLSLDESGAIVGTTEGSSPYFSISVDAETGRVTFVQFLNVWHGDTEDHDDAVTMELLEGSILLTATATDGDGDTASASLDLSSGIFVIEDDGPSVVGAPLSVSIDEANINTDYSVGTEPGEGPALISGSLASLVDFGTDGQGHFAFTDDTIEQLDALGLASKQSFFGLRSVALEYSVAEDGDFLVLSATEPDINPWSGDTSNPVFELRLNTETGQYEFRLYDELVHTGDQGNVIGIDFGSMIQAVDADGDSVVLEDVFTINIQDDEPIANDDFRTINEDTYGKIVGNVTSNDVSGADESLDFKNWDSPDAQYGTFRGYSNGTYSYNLDNALAQQLDDGESWTETFDYSIRDTDGDESTATLTITIEGRNDRPTISVTTGNRWNANDHVDEAALPSGSDPDSNAEYAYGTFKVADPDGLDDIKSVTINGQTFLITALVGKEVAGDSGTLTITSYNAATGVAGYEYVLEEATTDVPHKFEVDKFTLTTSDGDLTSTQAYINIVIDDDQPIARNDTDTVDVAESESNHPNMATGNVISGADTDTGDLGADTPGADQPAQVTRIGFDADENGSYQGSSEVETVGSAGVSIDGKYGTLFIKQDGSYEYTVDPQKLPGATLLEPNSEGWSVETKAFQLDQSFFDTEGKYSSTGTGVVTNGGNFPANGVDSDNDNTLSVPAQLNYAGSLSEALAFEFGGPVSAASVTVSNLFQNENGGEAARWHAFDADGNRIATGVISQNAAGEPYANSTSVTWDSNNVGTFTVSDIGTFETLVIEAVPYSNDGFAQNDDSDFFATVVSYEALPEGGTAYQEVFKYELTDADGDHSYATLTINGLEPNPEGTFVNQAPVAEDNHYSLESSSIAGNIITDDNDGEGAASGRDWDADTPVANLSVHSISWTENGELVTENLNGMQQVVNLQFGTLTIDPDGSYTYALNAGANEQVDRFEYKLVDVHGEVSDSAEVTFAMPDSVPTANPDQIVAGTVSNATVNLVFAIDSSGSISNANLQLMKNAVTNLMDEYGDSLVKVMLVDFDNDAVVKTAGNEVWLTTSQVTAALADIASGGQTDYDAVLTAIETSYGTPPDADKTYIYFMSDGNPVGSDSGNPNTIEPAERSNWINFLGDKGISEVYAVGVGSGVTTTSHLLDVAWSSSGNDADNVRLVSSAAELSATLTEIAQQVPGSVLTNDDPGADGIGTPALVSVEFDGTTYTFDQTGDPDHHVIDLGTGKGSLLIEADGDFNYTPPAGGAYGSSVVVNYTMQDGDGSTSSSTLTIDPNDLPVAVDDSDVARVGYYQVSGNVTESASVTTPASWGDADSTPVSGDWDIDPGWLFDTNTSDSFTIVANSSHTASVTVGVELFEYKSGDVVQVRLLKDGSTVRSENVEASGNVVFSGITQSGAYSVQVYGNDNTWGWLGFQNGNLKATINNISFTDYQYTAATTHAINVTAPDMAWVAAVTAVGNVLNNDDQGIQGAQVASVHFGSSDYVAGDVIIADHGTLTIDAAGAFTYTPTADNVPAGTQEVFTYTIEQPDGDVDTATLTIDVSGHVYTATDGNDLLVAQASGDSIDGLDGDDRIVGSDSADTLTGGAGNDYIEGGEGDDVLYGGVGSDYLSGGDGNDTLYGGAGDDILTGGTGSDTFAYTDGDLVDVVDGDIITDFELGVDGDTLDLSALLSGTGGLDQFLDFTVSNNNGAGTATIAVQVSQGGDENFIPLATIEVSGVTAGADDAAVEAMLKAQIDV